MNSTNISNDVYNIFMLSILLKYTSLINNIINNLINYHNNTSNKHLILNNQQFIKQIDNTILYINYILPNIKINNKLFTKVLNKKLFNSVNSVFDINKFNISKTVNKNDIPQILEDIINNIVLGINIINKIINNEKIKNEINEYKNNQIASDILKCIDEYILSLYYIKSETFINKEVNTLMKNHIKILALCNNQEPFIYSYQINNQLINKYIENMIKKENKSENYLEIYGGNSILNKIINKLFENINDNYKLLFKYNDLDYIKYLIIKSGLLINIINILLLNNNTSETKYNKFLHYKNKYIDYILKHLNKPELIKNNINKLLDNIYVNMIKLINLMN